MEKKKILIVQYSLGNGGGEKALVNMLNSFPADKYDIELQLFENKGINLQFLPSFVTLREPLFPQGVPSSKQQLKIALRQGRLGVVLKKMWYLLRARRANEREKTYYAWCGLRAFCPANTTRYDMAIAAMQGPSTYYTFDEVVATKKVCWVHIDYSEIPLVKCEESYFKQAYRVVTVSERCGEALKESFPALNNVLVLYNLNCPALIHEMASAQTAQECFPDDYQYHIVSIGRYASQKGFDIAIDAAALLKKQGLSFAWYFLGEGELRAQLEKQARECGVDDRIKLIGAVSNPYPYIRCADVVAQTSRYEGKSMVLDEAKILCRPILSTAYGSVYDQLEDGVNGVIVPISAEGIAEGLQRVLQDETLRSALQQTLAAADDDQTALIEQHYALLEGRL